MPSSPPPSLRSLWVATLCLGVALAGFATAATPKSAAKMSGAPKKASEQLTATFSIPKQSYTVGYLIEGTITMKNTGPARTLQVRYDHWNGKKMVPATRSLRLGKGKQATLPVDVLANKPGPLEIRYVVTQKGNKTFKKVFTHQVKVEAEDKTTTISYEQEATKLFQRVYGRRPNSKSGNDQNVMEAYVEGFTMLAVRNQPPSTQSRAGCPLTPALVRELCEIPKPISLALHPQDCDVILAIGSAPTDERTIVAYRKTPIGGPLTSWDEIIEKETSKGRFAYYEKPGLGDRAILFGIQLKEESKGEKDLEILASGAMGLFVSKGGTMHLFGTSGYQSHYFVPIFGCAANALEALARRILK